MSWLSSILGGGGGGRVSGTEARALVGQGAALVDVRSPAEFASGHVPGSRNIPLDQLPSRLGELDATKPVVVCCLSGGRSARAAGVLRQAGLTVHDLGPWSAW
jgi:rhodanese-related sulfurtransferase